MGLLSYNIDVSLAVLVPSALRAMIDVAAEVEVAVTVAVILH